MSGVTGPLRQCRSCGRTFNRRINDYCPACGDKNRVDELREE